MAFAFQKFGAAAFLATALQLPANATTVGSIEGSELTAQIESIYVALLTQGTIPVHAVQVGKGDTIEKIMRRETSTRDSYFPEILDALACDLNRTMCSRDLRKPGSSGVIKIANPLELDYTTGNWRLLQPGAAVLVPRLRIERNVVSIVYKKSAGESIQNIAAQNEACRAEGLDLEGCERYLEYLNYSNVRYAERDYAGSLFIPYSKYFVSVPQGCNEICANINSPISVNLSTDAFLSEPFLLLTANAAIASKTDAASALVKEDISFRDLSGVPPPQFNDIRSKGQSFSTRANEKLDSAIKTLERKVWRGTPDYERNSSSDVAFTKSFDYSTQSIALKSINYPTSKIDKIAEDIEKYGTDQSVLIIDTQFDAKHCEFGDRLKVYDCRKTRSNATSCPLYQADFSYSNFGDIYAGTTPGLSGAAATPAEREKCGAAGIVNVESPQGGDAYIAPRHGTHLASVIGARWDGFGAGGVNEYAKIIGVMVDMDSLNDEAYGRWLLLRLKRILIEEKVTVVDFSAGYYLTAPSQTSEDRQSGQDWLSTLITENEHQQLFVVSAGNKVDLNCQLMPACLTGQKNLVSVVALDQNGSAPRPNASTNSRFTLGAPAEQIFGAMPMNKYGYLSGSSQSAAIVAGAVSLAMSRG